VGNLPLVIAIDSGATTGGTYEGVAFQADKYYDGGELSSTTDEIAGTTADAMFRTERYGTYSYKIPVTTGTFTIKLFMAEIFNSAAGTRSFNVSVEGQKVLSNVDLYTLVGHDGAYEYVVENVRVTDGTLDIALESIVDNATLAGFAIYSADGKLDTSIPEPEPSNCSGYVAITYDDGPTGNTSSWVSSLKQNGLTPVTFFVNGANIGNNTAAIRQMMEVGEIQSHAHNHVDMGGYSVQQVTQELTNANQAIQNAGAPKPTIFRPPYGTVTNNIRSAASALGLYTVTWDVDSADWNGASVQNIVSAVGRAQNGQVILMHQNQNNSLQAIPQIAANLKSRGLCPGRISPTNGRAIAP
jgi:peptidoglycan/xylan/chitin deacetylase (PgdA/CDA1 family)